MKILIIMKKKKTKMKKKRKEKEKTMKTREKKKKTKKKMKTMKKVKKKRMKVKKKRVKKRRKMKKIEINRADVAASFQAAVVDVLTDNSVRAAKAYGCEKLALAGGVASNSALRARMTEACEKAGVSFYYPSPVYCTDNAAMIGVQGYHAFMAGERSGLDLNAVPNLKIGER